MGKDTGISWTNHSWNPWIGCTEVGPGCQNCYARSMVERFGGGHWGSGAPRWRTSAANWGEPARWNRALIAGKDIGRKVFACSMADFFDNEVDPAWRAAAWPIIEQTRALRWQICTKRIGNVLHMLPRHWREWPKHIGIIATMVNQAEVDRDMPKLRMVKDAGAPWIGVSYEPALGPISFRETGYPDWVIIGGESAQGGQPARPFDMAWPQQLIGEAKGKTAIFVKQLGSHVSVAGARITGTVGKGDDPTLWPNWIRLQEFPEALRT